MAYGMDYVVVLVDKWSDSPVHLISDKQKVQVFEKGMVVRGSRHGLTRPTVIVDLIKDRTVDGDRQRFLDWYSHCVLPAGDSTTKIIRA